MNSPHNHRLRTIIIDDDPITQTHLSALLGAEHDVEIKGTFDSITPSLRFVESETVDLIFVDVRLNGASGFEFLRRSASPAEVVVISAEPANAAEAFEYDVLHFLTKPITSEQFSKAMSRVRGNFAQRGIAAEPNHLYVRADHGFRRINYTSILYIESRRDYAMFHLTNDRLLIRGRMKDIEQALSNSPNFFRCHRSYIINVNVVDFFNGTEIAIGERSIPMTAAGYQKMQQLVNVL
jgi:DNA-binding LytR/AlgR family response regulator